MTQRAATSFYLSGDDALQEVLAEAESARMHPPPEPTSPGVE